MEYSLLCDAFYIQSEYIYLMVWFSYGNLWINNGRAGLLNLNGIHSLIYLYWDIATIYVMQ